MKHIPLFIFTIAIAGCTQEPVVASGKVACSGYEWVAQCRETGGQHQFVTQDNCEVCE